jgi:acetyltransferase-like isoleucine patch superfamily enzyme
MPRWPKRAVAGVAGRGAGAGTDFMLRLSSGAMAPRRSPISRIGLAEFVRWLPQRIGYVHGPTRMSWLRQQWVRLRHPHADIRFGRGVYLGPGFSLDVPGEGSFIVGDDVEFRRDFRAEISERGRITIGKGTHFTYSVLVQCSTTIDIGERAMFGQSTIVLDGQHRFRDISRPMLDQGYDFQPLRIGDDATITTKCTIMADVGTRAFVGANSVVTRPVPPYTVAVGAPARPVDYFGPPGEEPDGWAKPAGSDAS